MRGAVLALCVGLAACATPPAPDAPLPSPVVDLSLRAAPGEAWRVVYERDLAVSENGATSRSDTVETYRVDVLEPGLWRWTFENAGSQGWTRQISAIECSVNANGRCLEVRNWDALRRDLVLTASAREGDRHADALEQILTSITAEDAGAFALEGVSILGRIQGLRLRLGETVRFNANQPNPLGGDPTPMSGEVRLVSIDAATQTARLIFRQEMTDEEGGAAVRAAMLRMLSSQPGADPLSLEEAARLVDGLLGRIDSRWMEDGEATVDLATGRVLEARSTIAGRLRATGGRQELDTSMQGDVVLRQVLLTSGS